MSESTKLSGQGLPSVLAIAGPTASGKSALALRVADALNGEIVNADALQVYAGLRVLTARPSAEEEAAAPHWLYGHVDPGQRHSVGSWSREVVPVIDEIVGRGRRAILVGGTGLYFRSLFKGLAEVPQPSDEGVAQATALLDQGVDVLRAEAERLDPVPTARVLGNDPQRLLRIVSVALGTEKTLSAWQAETHPVITDWAGVVVTTERADLYRTIERRFDTMVERGGLEEAARFAERRLDDQLPAMKAIGVKELVAAAKGEMELDAAIVLAKQQSRRLAKRQMTWFRNQTPDWPRVSVGDDMDRVVAAFASGVKANV